jgi:hypothetical protein
VSYISALNGAPRGFASQRNSNPRHNVSVML